MPLAGVSERDRTFSGRQYLPSGQVFHVVLITDTEGAKRGWYWWYTDNSALFKGDGPFPCAEGAYLAAIRD
jgi:hypothetical protein